MTSPSERRLAAIMFTDIVGYTALMAASEERGLRARERHRALVRPLVATHRGESIEAKGDESLSVFPNVLDAVRCALELEDHLRDEPDLRLHIGIHLGDVVVHDGEVSGDGVNIASRICALSREGGIRVSDEVHRAIRNQPDVESVALGQRKLKNVGQPVAVYAVGRPETLAAVRRSMWWQAVARLGLVFAGVLGVIGAASAWWTYRDAATEAVPIRSLAVLPLENLSGDPGQEYFADGMTEELIGALAKLRDLRVISRTSVMQYKRERKPLPEIAQELNVDGIIEGTVTRADDRVRITAQLIDARNDHHLWSERYDRDLRDVLALQSDIARAVAEQVRIELSPEQRAAHSDSRSVDPRAYDAYLRGLEARGRGYFPAVWAPPAIEQFERAVELDPGFAEAYAALANARVWLAGNPFDTRSSTGFPSARKAAQRALELDDRLGGAQADLGSILLIDGWDFESARRAYERAVEISPSDPTALNNYAWYLLVVGRTEEALAVMERLLRVAPFDRFYRGVRIRNFAWARRYERALEELEQVRKLDSNFAEFEEPRIYLKLGRLDEAHRAHVALYERCGPPCAWMQEAIERGFREGGWEASLRSLAHAAEGREEYSPGLIGLWYSDIGETEKAFLWLERGYRERDPVMVLVKLADMSDHLRSDPRFQDLLRRIGFPES